VAIDGGTSEVILRGEQKIGNKRQL